MRRYLATRLIGAIPSLLGLSFLILALSGVSGDPSYQIAARNSLGGDPPPEAVEFVRHQLGLDRPLPERYVKWLGEAVRGRLGDSLFTGRSVKSEISMRSWATVKLAVSAVFLTALLAIPMGVAAAFYHRRWPDHLLRGLCLMTASMPGFLLCYLLIAVMAVHLRLLPVAGMSGATSMILPALAVSLAPAALVSRLLRSSLLESMSQDFVRTALAKGISMPRLLITHVLRNAALPPLTALSNVFARLLEGAVIVEIVFAWPGLGRLTYDAIANSDYPVIQGTVLLAGALFVLTSLLIDVGYSVINPQVRIGRRSR